MGSGEEKAIVALVPLAGYEDQEAVDAAVLHAIELLGGAGRFVSAGQRVLLKPNFVAPARPEQAVCTHPAIVRAVIRALKSAAPACIDIGDGPGVSDAKNVAKTSGIQAVADEEGATVVNFTDSQPYVCEENTLDKRIGLTTELACHDVLITLPKLKTHSLMAMTCALKNQYGLIPGMTKAQHHFRFQNRDRFADFVIDINRTAHPNLAIVDAVVAMEGPGPSGGTPRKVGVVIAGDDLTAVDAVAAALISLPQDGVPLLQAAKRVKYGVADLENIEIRGAELAAFVVGDFQLIKPTSNIMHILPLPMFMLRWLRRQLMPRPTINPKKCIRCNRCKNGCPAKPAAIDPSGNKGKPILYDNRCIRCYCCHEFCPVKAIDLKRSWFERIFHVTAVMRCLHGFLGKIASLFYKIRRPKR